MINLQKTSGLPIELTDDFHIKFLAPLKEVIPSVRKFSEMIPVLAMKDAKPNPPAEETYYMYRDVHMPEHEAAMRAKHLRHDLTVIPAIMLGREFNKTLGHYHPLVPGTNLAYPELYEVLEGEALFMIQKVDSTGKEIEDIQAITAKVGDKIIYPPGYAHIIVNIGNGPLVTANWVADNFKSLYQPIEDMGGMGYFVFADPDKRLTFVENPKYEFLPLIKSSSIGQSGRGLNSEEPVYSMGVKSLHSLSFLTDPEILTAH